MVGSSLSTLHLQMAWNLFPSGSVGSFSFSASPRSQNTARPSAIVLCTLFEIVLEIILEIVLETDENCTSIAEEVDDLLEFVLFLKIFFENFEFKHELFVTRPTLTKRSETIT